MSGSGTRVGSDSHVLHQGLCRVRCDCNRSNMGLNRESTRRGSAGGDNLRHWISISHGVWLDDRIDLTMRTGLCKFMGIVTQESDLNFFFTR